MKKLYVVAAIAATLPALYFLHQQIKTAQHQRELQACSEKFEQIRTDAAKISSVNLYPFQKHKWDYLWVSNFDGGVAAFLGTKEDRQKQGFVDFNGNIVLEYQDPLKIDTLFGFWGFKNGRTEIFIYDHEAVPWGFLLPYGNPVPRIYGTLDCTGKVTFRRKGKSSSIDPVYPPIPHPSPQGNEIDS